MKTSCLAVSLCLVLLGAGMASAQMFNVDLDAADSDIDKAHDVNKGGTVTANIVVSGVEDLLGLSADILFDATEVLELTDIQAVFGDLDFSSDIPYQEIFNLISFYVSETPVDEFVDFNGNQSGIIVDKNRDNEFDYSEIFAAISQYVLKDSGGTQFWTDQLVNDESRDHMNESVPVFDPVAKSNTGGEHPGLIEDITAVLLRRPDGSEGGTTATGFGYDCGTYGNAIVCTLRFKVKSDAPTGASVISFGKSVMIDENFSNIDTDIIVVPNESSTLNVQ